MKFLRTLVLASFALAASSAAAFACQFEDAISGNCPQLTAELPSGAATDGGNTGVIAKKFAWTKWVEFSGLKSGEMITLKVCIFRGPVAAVSGYAFKPMDYSKDKSGFKQTGIFAESASKAWQELEAEVNGSKRVSRLQFDFKDASGNYRACEDMKKRDWHIAIARNAAIKSAYIGHGHEPLPFSRKNATATMVLGNNKADAIHEFGHAIGFTHEMVHKDWKPCLEAFSSEKYAKNRSGFGGSYEIIKKSAERNVIELIEDFEKIEVDDTETIDGESIMTYVFYSGDFEKDKLKKGTACVLPRNNSISGGDKKLFLLTYGKKTQN